MPWVSHRELQALRDLYRSIGRAEAQMEASQKVVADCRERTARALARNDRVIAKVRDLAVALKEPK